MSSSLPTFSLHYLCLSLFIPFSLSLFIAFSLSLVFIPLSLSLHTLVSLSLFIPLFLSFSSLPFSLSLFVPFSLHTFVSHSLSSLITFVSLSLSHLFYRCVFSMFKSSTVCLALLCFEHYQNCSVSVFFCRTLVEDLDAHNKVELKLNQTGSLSLLVLLIGDSTNEYKDF